MPEQRGDGQGQVTVGTGADIVTAITDPVREGRRGVAAAQSRQSFLDGKCLLSRVHLCLTEDTSAGLGHTNGG